MAPVLATAVEFKEEDGDKGVPDKAARRKTTLQQQYVVVEFLYYQYHHRLWLTFARIIAHSGRSGAAVSMRAFKTAQRMLHSGELELALNGLLGSAGGSLVKNAKFLRNAGHNMAKFPNTDVFQNFSSFAFTYVLLFVAGCLFIELLQTYLKAAAAAESFVVDNAFLNRRGRARLATLVGGSHCQAAAEMKVLPEAIVRVLLERHGDVDRHRDKQRRSAAAAATAATTETETETVTEFRVSSINVAHRTIFAGDWFNIPTETYTSEHAAHHVAGLFKDEYFRLLKAEKDAMHGGKTAAWGKKDPESKYYKLLSNFDRYWRKLIDRIFDFPSHNCPTDQIYLPRNPTPDREHEVQQKLWSFFNKRWETGQAGREYFRSKLALLLSKMPPAEREQCEEFSRLMRAAGGHGADTSPWEEASEEEKTLGPLGPFADGLEAVAADYYEELAVTTEKWRQSMADGGTEKIRQAMADGGTEKVSGAGKSGFGKAMLAVKKAIEAKIDKKVKDDNTYTPSPATLYPRSLAMPEPFKELEDLARALCPAVEPRQIERKVITVCDAWKKKKKEEAAKN
eukprot:g359.t1